MTRLPPHVVARIAAVPFGDGSLNTVLTALAVIAEDAVPGADVVSLTLLHDDTGHSAAFTATLALEVDEAQYALGYGPCLDAARSGTLLEIARMPVEARWPQYAARAARLGVMSSLSVPLPLQTELVGALNVYSRRPDAFDRTARELAVEVAGCMAVACANAYAYSVAVDRAAHMQAAMASRAAIEQAKGMIMSSNRCGADEAFEILRAASMGRNIKLRDIAEQMVRGYAAVNSAGSASPTG